MSAAGPSSPDAPRPDEAATARGGVELAASRRVEIVRLLEALGGARVTDLAERFDVSEMTIRRDLDDLDRRGLARKVHGGALPTGGTTEDPGFERKSRLAMAEKRAIAGAAAQMVEPGMSVILSAGTTTWYLGGLLRAVPALTVVTNSANIARQVHDPGTSGQHVILTGGTFRTPSDALVGEVARAALGHVHADLLFLGVHGLDLEHGLTTPTLAEAEVDRLMLRQSRRAVVLADHTKPGVVGFAHVAPLSDVDVLVCGDPLDEAWRGPLAEAVGHLRLVDVGVADDDQA
ncbi:MAG: DeoR/GlpR family DNA-binding transcription regulator [Egibacteraceae bacterium]